MKEIKAHSAISGLEIAYVFKSSPSSKPTEKTLQTQLRLEWQGHEQTRAQIWKTPGIQALLIVGLDGGDIKFANIWVVVVLGTVMLISGIAGILITRHHGIGQIRKFRHILRIDEQLGLHKPGLLDDVGLPTEFRWFHIIEPWQTNTPLFILRMHVAITVFVVIYIIVRAYGAAT
mgnify:CR=1 FL=1